MNQLRASGFVGQPSGDVAAPAALRAYTSALVTGDAAAVQALAPYCGLQQLVPPAEAGAMHRASMHMTPWQMGAIVPAPQHRDAAWSHGKLTTDRSQRQDYLDERNNVQPKFEPPPRVRSPAVVRTDNERRSSAARLSNRARLTELLSGLGRRGSRDEGWNPATEQQAAHARARRSEDLSDDGITEMLGTLRRSSLNSTLSIRAEDAPDLLACLPEALSRARLGECIDLITLLEVLR